MARWADIWNAFGSPQELARKDDILRGYCEEVGRDPEAIVRSVGCKITIRQTEAEAREALVGILRTNDLKPQDVADDETFWTGTPRQIAERMMAYLRVGFHAFIVESPAPYDVETLETLVHEVRSLVERGGLDT